MSADAEHSTSPQSAYANQLLGGFRALRFEPPLELEFREEFVRQHLRRTRIGLAVVIALYALFLLLRWRVESGVPQQWGLILRATAITAMSMVLVASYLQRLRTMLPLLTLAGYAIFAASMTGIQVLAKRYGLDRQYEALILMSFHLYIFSGLIFRPALAAGGAIFLAYLLGGAIGGLADRIWAYQLLFIALTQVIGAAALYSIEWVERDSFLRRRLLSMLAMHDSLTGLFNRMAFAQQFEGRTRQAARDGIAIGVLLFDVDHFKKYNDRYGHVEGDACLRAVAAAVRQEFKRPSDMLARYGGEEFIGYWYNLAPQSLRELADRVRAAVQALGIAHKDAPSGRVTISVGAVACVPGESEALQALIERADRLLYEAKDKGRNRVVVELLPSARGAPRADGRRAPTLSAS